LEGNDPFNKTTIGYVAGQTHGIIATTSNQSSNWGYSDTYISGTNATLTSGASGLSY
jgi:hypothetical protein